MLKQLLHSLGIGKPEVKPAAKPVVHIRMKLFRHHGINRVIDVGAHAGRYALKLRKMGYTESIISLEPLPVPFAKLSKAAEADPAWKALNVAVGDRNGTVRMHVSKNEVSSSFLPVTTLGKESEPSVESIEEIDVPMITLDSIQDELVPAGARSFLKIDVQGYTLPVLEGARACLEKSKGSKSRSPWSPSTKASRC